MEEHPELRELVLRRFKNEGDAQKGLEMVRDTICAPPLSEIALSCEAQFASRKSKYDGECFSDSLLMLGISTDDFGCDGG